MAVARPPPWLLSAPDRVKAMSVTRSVADPESAADAGKPRRLTGDYDFVVVASRLPVDRVDDPGSGESQWRPSPGGLVTALQPVMRDANGAWVGWPGSAGDALEPFDADGMHLVDRRPVRRRGPRLLRGLLQRHAVAAVSRRHRAAGVPPPVVGRLRDGQPALRRGGGRAGRARRDRVGQRLPAPAGPRHAARAPRRRAHRLLQPHPVPGLRDLRPAALAPSDRRRPARRRPAGLPAPERRDELPAGLPPRRRDDHERAR